MLGGMEGLSKEDQTHSFTRKSLQKQEEERQCRMDFVLEKTMLKKRNEGLEKALKESKQREDKMKSELQKAWERFKVAEEADRRLRNEVKILGGVWECGCGCFLKCFFI